MTIIDIDSASTPSETDDQTVLRLAQLTPIEYDRVRDAEAKGLKVRASTLDSMVKAARLPEEKENEGGDDLINGVLPWSKPVDGLELALEIRELFNAYCVLPTGADVALVLWSMATYSIDQFRIFPKACLSSPEKRCGKTTTLEVIGAVVDRGLMASNLSAAVLFRVVDAWRPSLLIDEADTFIHGNEELRGVINSGHTRSTAFVLRVEGDSGDRKPVKFSTWSPMCIAMIKTPPDTIRDRSIMVTLRRKLPGESVTKMPLDLSESVSALRQRCKRWSNDQAGALRSNAPDVPKISNERAMDNWTPLLAVADQLGGDWPALARASMLSIESTNDDDDTGVGPMILTDIRQVFIDTNADKLSSQEIVDALIELEDRPWCEWRKGQPMSKNSLARLLRPFKIKSKDIRLDFGTKRGYSLEQFTDTFVRYLTPLSNTPVQSATTLQANGNAGCSDFQSATPNDGVALQNPPNPRRNAGCSTVALENATHKASSNEVSI